MKKMMRECRVADAAGFMFLTSQGSMGIARGWHSFLFLAARAYGAQGVSFDTPVCRFPYLTIRATALARSSLEQEAHAGQTLTFDEN
jgi:hypothetical protein